MKSIKQVPITHPTKPFLDAQLEEVKKEMQKIDFCIRMLNWGNPGDSLVFKVPLPVPNHMDSAWQTIVYEIATKSDYDEFVKKYEEICRKVRGGEDA